MLRESDLLEAVQTLEPRLFYGQGYRVFSPKYIRSPISTQGAFGYGGRYNPKGIHALYIAEDPVTGLAENRLIVSPQSSPLYRPATRILLALEYRLQRVLDLSDTQVLEALSTSYQELTGDWEPYNYQGKTAPTQQLGAAVFASGQFEAIRYPSAQNRQQHNLAVFKERLLPQSHVRVMDASGVFSGALPEDGSFNG